MTFLSKIKDGCLASWEHGILPSVSAAQAILESGWGESLLAQYPNHNLFGIKASSDWKGNVLTFQLKNTLMGNSSRLRLPLESMTHGRNPLKIMRCSFQKQHGDVAITKTCSVKKTIKKPVSLYKRQVMRQILTMGQN